jgi:hypothetical protein
VTNDGRQIRAKAASCSLSHVLGGKGWGEGAGASDVQFAIVRRHVWAYQRAAADPRRWPLSLTLSPEYVGEETMLPHVGGFA